MSEELRYEYGDKTILELQQLLEADHLNLEPGFQRKSVWSDSDRRKLIESILQGYPIPSIFLYRRDDNGRPVYDVIDGKQRLETIFMFTRASGFAKSGFEIQFKFPNDDLPVWYNWSLLKRTRRTSPLLSYKIQTAEITGDTGDIINLFVRINSTGKALTSAEKRNARFRNSPFLHGAIRLANKFKKFLVEARVVRGSQLERMKDVELITELLASVVAGGPIHKKAAVDQAVGNTALFGPTLKKAIREVIAVMNLLRRIFPELRNTRFHNISEFYTLFMVVWEMWTRKLVLNDRKRNAIAQKMLVRLSNGADEAWQMQKSLRLGKKIPDLFSNYLLTVQQSTDALSQRKIRASIVSGILGGIFAAKDLQRVFSTEQRRLLWNSDEKKKCSQCGETLDWTNFQVDHVKPHSRGGKTHTENAALICRFCNASKGARATRGGKKNTARRQIRTPHGATERGTKAHPSNRQGATRRDRTPWPWEGTKKY